MHKKIISSEWKKKMYRSSQETEKFVYAEVWRLIEKHKSRWIKKVGGTSFNSKKPRIPVKKWHIEMPMKKMVKKN